VRIAIVVFDGFDEVDAIGPYEVLQNAVLGGADAEVDLVTLDPAERVTASHGLVVEPQGQLDGSYDLVVVPGGGWNDRAPSGAFAEAQRGELPAALADLHEDGAVMASVCTGGMLLSAAGLTRGRPAVTHHAALEEFASAGAEVVDARVVDDGNLVTSGGVTSGIDLALWIVEREWGKPLADGIAAEMEHDRRGPVWQREGQTGAE
jgi:transcriptional regulator GlxA family with amidase domain